MAIADICVVTRLPAVSWPGRFLCHLYPTQIFPWWTGAQCQTQCQHPARIENSGMCVCKAGYWGDVCSSICPGGVASPCNNRGRCDQLTGRCVCSSNWRGSSCATCAEDWYGQECNIAVQTPPPNPHVIYSSISGNGHLSTLDGANVQLDIEGVFTWYKVEGSVHVQVQKGPCSALKSCALSVAVSVSDVIVTISALQGGIITINNQTVQVDQVIDIITGYQLIKLDLYVYKITGPNKFEVEVSIKSGYINTYLSISPSSCSNVLGVSGICRPNNNHGCGNDDHLCWIQNIGLAATVKKFSVSVSVLHQHFTSWTVDYHTSYFASVTSLVQSTSGFAIAVNNGWVSTTPFEPTLFIHESITVELRLKFTTQTAGTILSYALEKTFAVVVSENIFNIHFGATVFTTSITISVGDWSHIALVYNRVTGVLVFHYIYSTDVSVYTVLQVSTGCFPVDGTMVLGSWQLSTSGVGSPPPGTAVFSVDRLLVWDRHFSPQEVFVHWQISVSTQLEGLRLGWNFDEGSGTTSTDFVRKYTATISATGTGWGFCDVYILPGSHVPVELTNTQPDETSVATCSMMLKGSSSIATSCNSIQVTLDFYFLTCIQDTTLSGNQDYSMDTTLAVSTICQQVLDLNVWPAQVLCNSFPSQTFPSWIGLSCNVRCLFGTADNAGACVCHNGYWGVHCDRVCPGGHVTPCSNHGSCDTGDGICSCDENWQGDKTCSSCSPNWIGDNCEIMKVKLPPQAPRFCSINKQGSMIKFNRQGVFLDQTGTIDFISMGNLNIKVRQRLCPIKRKRKRRSREKLCIDKISVAMANVTIEIQNIKKKQHIIEVNNERLRKSRVQTIPTNGGCSLVLNSVRRTKYTINNSELGLKLTVTVVQNSLNLIVKLSSELCCSQPPTGKCGNDCGACPTVPSAPKCGLVNSSNSETGGSGPRTQSGSGTEVTDEGGSWETPGIDNITLDGLSPGKGVCFDNSSLGATQLKLFQGKSNSMEFFVRTCSQPSCYGTIMSYSKSKTFSIHHSSTVNVKYDDFTFDTGLSLEDNQWNQISLVYDGRGSNSLDVYVFNSSGIASRATTTTMPKPNPLTTNGDLSLGKWQPSSKKKGGKQTELFLGCIDELRFWKSYLSPPEVTSHWNKTYDSTDKDLAALWKFDEAENDGTTYDEIGAIPLYRPASPFRGGVYAVSNAPIPYIPSTTSTTNQAPAPGVYRRKRQTDTAVIIYNTDICDMVFHHSSLSSTCQNASSTVQQKYFYDCSQSTDLDSIADAMVTYTDFCQVVLNLDQWPGQNICEEFKADANFYQVMGEYCDPPCNFGTRDVASSCECIDGYWNQTCDEVCPGGFFSPCSGYGTCDQSTGKCDCPMNKNKMADCSECSNGWYGKDCNIAENIPEDNTNLIASAGRLGHLYSFDGLSFMNQVQGEYLLLAVSHNVIIQGKMVICYQNYTCMPFIAVRIGDDTNGYATITFQATRRYSSKPAVYINTVEQVLDTPAYFKGFSVQRSSLFEITVDVTNHFSFTIQVEGRYLHLKAIVPSSIVTMTTGMLSGSASVVSSEKLAHLFGVAVPDFNICGSPAVIQTYLASPDSSTLTLQSFTQNVTSTSGNDLDLSRFEVKACDKVIHYPSEADARQTMGGYSLSFQRSSVYTDIFIDTTTTPNITFDFLVKLNTSSSDSAVLFAFVNDMVFMLASKSQTVELHIYQDENTTVIDTGLSLELGAWNHVVLTYYSLLGYTNIYVFNSSGIVERRTFILQTNIFENKGLLSLGHWTPPYNGITYAAPTGLTGEMDNFLIWKIPIEADIVLDVWQLDPSLAFNSLLFSFLFDEGDGYVAKDNIQYKESYLPQYPWVPPTWQPSDLVYNTKQLPEVHTAFFSNISLQIDAEEMCSREILDTNQFDNCGSLTLATRQFFYLECLHTFSTTSKMADTYDVILELHTICQVSHNMNQNVSQSMCDSISVDIKNRTTCQSPCKFGYIEEDGGCLCASGYYGNLCDNVCPGNSDNPCSNHGNCEPTGLCDCWWNWQGSNNCSTCSPGMSGIDCSVLQVSSLVTAPSTSLAYVTSNGHYMTFSGQQVHIDSGSGPFRLFKSSINNIDIHVYQVVCAYGSCIAAASVSMATTSLVILPPSKGHVPILYKNGQEFRLADMETTIDSSLKIFQHSLASLEVQATSIGSILLNFTVHEQFLQFTVSSDSTICKDASGILDACASSTATDYSSMSTAGMTEYIVQHFKLNSSIILDTLQSPGVETPDSNSGYALLFNNTASMSVPLQYPETFDLTEEDFSLSIFFKPYNYSGTILSYGKSVTFAILNTQPIKIQYGSTIVATSVSAELDDWNQVVMTFRRSTQEIHFFHYGPNISITYDILSLDCPDLFQEFGVIMLGEWSPSTDSSPYTLNTSYTGLIDEVSIWKSAIHPSLVYQAYHLNIKLSGFSQVMSSLYTFTEGIGNIAYEEVRGNNMLLPRSPWQSPSWTVSDLNLEIIRTDLNIETVQINPDIQQICQRFFDNVTVSVNCPGLSVELRWWFSQTCSLTASKTGNQTDVTMAMADYAGICETMGGNSEPLYELICSLNIMLPDWLQQRCSKCLFGYHNENGSCVCYFGYWGDHCESSCPGGVISPCNGHGSCDMSGDCQCRGRWNGSNCDVCQDGWYGEECILFNTGYNVSGSLLVSQVNLIGQIITFDGTVFDVNQRQYYTLLSISSLDIQIHIQFSICQTGSEAHACLVGFILSHEGETFYISHESYISSKVVILTMSQSYNLYNKLTFGKATFTLSTPSIVDIIFSHSDLSIKLTVFDTKLLLTVTLSQQTWSSLQTDLQGLAVSCNTTAAIASSTCAISRADLCSNPSQTTPSHCTTGLTLTSLNIYLSVYIYTDTTVISLIQNTHISAFASTCLFFNDSGISVTEITIPKSEFTLEFHVKVSIDGGVIMSYTYSSSYMILINNPTGLLVYIEGKYFQTGLLLEVQVWNQVSLAWRPDVQILEIYVSDSSGITKVKAISLPGATFTPGGTLTFGQVDPALTVSLSVGVFVGYVDEIRIWSRPHNPTIVARNWRVKIAPQTKDVSHSWGFDDGFGLEARPGQGGQTMLIDTVQNPPVWAGSDLDLSTEDALNELSMNQVTPVDSSALAVAMETCTKMISNSALSADTGSNTNTLLSAYTNMCVQNVLHSQTPAQAEAILLGVADLIEKLTNLSTSPIRSMCNELTSSPNVISWTGSNCTDLCIFGSNINNTTDTCSCLDSHWGTSCDQICPLGPLGACNSFGLCSADNGQCSCHPHWFGFEVTVEVFWSSYSQSVSLTAVALTYSCVYCSVDWDGSDCHFAISTNSTYVWSVGIIYGSYITTFDGASLTLITPGVYTLLEVDSISVQVLLLPCPGSNLCRYVHQISLQTGDSAVRITHVSYTDWIVETVEGGTVQNATYPFEKQLSVFKIEWKLELYVRIHFGSASILVYNSQLGLVCSVSAETSYVSSAHGLLGNSDGQWENDLICLSDSATATNSSLLSGNYVATCIKQRYQPASRAIHISHPSALLNLTSAGYILHLSGKTLTLSNFAVAGFKGNYVEMTLSFWIRIEVILSKVQTIFTFNIDGQNPLQVAINDKGLIVIIWDQTYLTTLYLRVEVWTYVAISWHSNTGTMTVYLISEKSLRYYIIYSVSTGATISPGEMTFTGDAKSYLDLDYFRLWSSGKDLDGIVADLKVYSTERSPNLLMVLPLDDGAGLDPELVTFSDTDTGASSDAVPTSVTAPESSGLWVPATVPIPDIHLPPTLQPSSSDMEAYKDCLKVLQNETYTKHCKDVRSGIKDHLLEACIRDYNRLGKENATRIFLQELIFHCQTVLQIDECIFSDMLDFCQPIAPSQDVFEWWMILIICIGVLIIVVVCCCCFFVIYCKKKKRKRQHELDEDNLFHKEDHNHGSGSTLQSNRQLHMETSFMDESLGWSQDNVAHSANTSHMGSQQTLDDDDIRLSSASPQQHGGLTSFFPGVLFGHSRSERPLSRPPDAVNFRNPKPNQKQARKISKEMHHSYSGHDLDLKRINSEEEIDPHVMMREPGHHLIPSPRTGTPEHYVEKHDNAAMSEEDKHPGIPGLTDEGNQRGLQHGRAETEELKMPKSVNVVERPEVLQPPVHAWTREESTQSSSRNHGDESRPSSSGSDNSGAARKGKKTGIKSGRVGVFGDQPVAKPVAKPVISLAERVKITKEMNKQLQSTMETMTAKAQEQVYTESTFDPFVTDLVLKDEEEEGEEQTSVL